MLLISRKLDALMAQDMVLITVQAIVSKLYSRPSFGHFVSLELRLNRTNSFRPSCFLHAAKAANLLEGEA